MIEVVMLGLFSPETKTPKYFPRMPFVVPVSSERILIFLQDIPEKFRRKWIRKFKKNHPHVDVIEFV
jgi:hypothetical protein